MPIKKRSDSKNGVALGALILLQTFLKVVCKALEARVQGKIEISIKTELFSSILKKDYEKIHLDSHGRAYDKAHK